MHPPNFIVLCGYFVHIRSNRNVSILKQGGRWELSAKLPEVPVDSVDHLFQSRRCCTNTGVLVVDYECYHFHLLCTVRFFDECLNLLMTVILMP
jgi:hypothetical protein